MFQSIQVGESLFVNHSLYPVVRVSKSRFWLGIDGEAVKFSKNSGKQYGAGGELQASYADTPDCADSVPEELRDLTNCDFSGQDLRWHDFSFCDLTGANFTNANLFGANFTGSVLLRANFSHSNVTKANFSSTNLRWATFAEAKISGAVFKNSRKPWTLFDEGVSIRCGFVQ